MAQLSIAMDDELKEKTEKVLDELGLGTATAVKIFFKAVVRENGIPFELYAEPLHHRENKTPEDAQRSAAEQ